MTTQRFSHTKYPIEALIAQIDSGDLTLPDLQRPFVWQRSRVRDLFDSLYHGYPAGYFLFWSTPAPVDSHAVAGSHGGPSGVKMIVDGQQRLTSLYCVMKGKPIDTDDGETQSIRISFNPLTEEFAVADAARENDPAWLTSISDMWTNDEGAWAFTNAFISDSPQPESSLTTTSNESVRISASWRASRATSSRRWSSPRNSTSTKSPKSSYASTPRASD
jgi:hypothetical protein